MEICHHLVAEGCPRCIGLPNLCPAIHSDPDLTRGWPMPNKAAPQKLLELLREEEFHSAVPSKEHAANVS